MRHGLCFMLCSASLGRAALLLSFSEAFSQGFIYKTAGDGLYFFEHLAHRNCSMHVFPLILIYPVS